MKRDVLKALDLSDEVVDKIMNEYGNSVNSLKAKNSDLEQQITTYKERLSERDTQLEALKKSASDSDKLQAQISKLQDENKKSAEEYEAKIQKMAKDNALNLALTNAKAKNPKAVRALLDEDKIQLDGETLVGFDDQIAKIKESDGYMFDGVTKPNISGTPPAQGSGAPAGSPKPGDYEYYVQLAESGQL